MKKLYRYLKFSLSISEFKVTELNMQRTQVSNLITEHERGRIE